MTRAEKVTVSLPTPLLSFVTAYQESHHLSRSEVVQQALQAFQEAELARAYRESAAEMQADSLFDTDSGHGLSASAEAAW
ncbi:MAG: hypothetical protein JWQ08_96 [Deinococcus sp.]|uniref:ribbon-helix-helix domain-containing protein n=1 Tax=Deinococcus sp. Arct2-2 TaxID=2568653 RepID=UPI0010A429E0|nr:ribbon-helix-helix domain-containing protein [Deinococcus sp. Arct2-2]MDB5044046.1 hypothetical protein [Deinococcus sp.]THF67647.1 CopG family transcriptional regulator [Deinococcus sp. Arct2-2]